MPAPDALAHSRRADPLAAPLLARLCEQLDALPPLEPAVVVTDSSTTGSPILHGRGLARDLLVVEGVEDRRHVRRAVVQVAVEGDPLSASHDALFQDVSVFRFTGSALVTQQVHKGAIVKSHLNLGFAPELVPATALGTVLSVDFDFNFSLFYL